MRGTRLAVGVVALLLLLTWLALRSSSTQLQGAQAALNALDTMEASESALDRDLLRARAGLLGNYDPLVLEIDTIRRTIVTLRRSMRADPAITFAIDRLAWTTERQEAWTEQFKSSNALLRNSLAYFSRFTTALSEDGLQSGAAQQVSRISAAIQHLTLDTSPPVAAEVDGALDAMSTDGLSLDQTDAVHALVAHGRLLRNLLPATDRNLKNLFSLTSRQQREAIRTAVMARIAASDRKASRYRYVLYGVSVLLVALIGVFGVQLESRARALRRRADIEHVIAGVSTSLIGAQPGELAGRIEHALESLAECVTADRAFFVAAGPAAARYRWSRPGAELPADWPRQEMLAEALPPYHDAPLPATGQSTSSDKRPGRCGSSCGSSPKKLCIAGSEAGDGLSGWLGFEAVSGRLRARQGDLGLFGMAFDAIANAVSREALERERGNLEVKLQQARRMETIGALASGIAHNFNNIVAAILGYAEMAQGVTADGSRAEESIGEIRRAGERARDLVEHILTFGRRSDLRRERVDLDALIAETRSLLDATLPGRIQLTVHPASTGRMEITGQMAQLQQVLLNLCNNAAQAIGDGDGKIEIGTGLVETAVSMQLDHGRLAAGRYALLSVTDDGPGMDEATLNRIFEPFFTTRTDGNGLGLATVLEIVREHLGGVRVESRPGAGTRFEIWLPCYVAAGMIDPPRPETDAHGDGQIILVYEPDRGRLLRHEEILAALGYEPLGFTVRSEAIAAVAASPTGFDAALLCQGREPLLDLATAMHRRAPELPLVLATASAEDYGVRALADAGVSEIVYLPLQSAELAGVLARCVTPALRLRAAEAGGSDEMHRERQRSKLGSLALPEAVHNGSG